jgi:hypothetical protein
MALELRAYCDESGTEGNDFVIAGYVAPASEWQKLETPWNEALQLAGLSEFKMSDCEMGTGEFAGRTDRPELQALFIALIRSIDARGFAARIDLATYLTVRERIAAGLRQGYDPAYLRTFDMEVQFITSVLDASVPKDERIAFIFDQQDEFAFKANQIYANMLQSHAQRDRLGPLSFADSKRLPPLQAADMLAYEVHRQFRHGERPPPDKVRWQSVRLSEGSRVSVGFLDEAAIKEWAEAWKTSAADQPSAPTR